MLIGVDGNEANVARRVGSNLYAYGLLKALNCLAEAREHEWVIYLKDRPLSDMPVERGGWHYRVIGPGAFWTRVRLPLDLYLHRPRPEVFFSPGHYTPGRCPVPLVAAIMDLGYLRFPDQFLKRDLWQLTRWTADSLRRASRILAISESTKREIEQSYPGVGEKVRVTYPGYDREAFERAIAERDVERVRRKYKLPEQYLVFVSTLKPSKNMEGLLVAFGEVVRNYPKVNLVICGKKGWLYESIWKRVEELGLNKKVIFTDYVEEKDLPGLLAGAYGQVLPSFWEGFGKTIPESMAVGTPVVASGVGSLPEVVGEVGILVDPYKVESIAEGLVRLLSMGKRDYESLVKKGLVQARQFSWEKCAKETLAVLLEVGERQ